MGKKGEVKPTKMSDCIIEFCEYIGVTSDAVRRAETIERFNLPVQVSAGQLKGIPKSAFEMLITLFDGSLELEVGLPDVAPLLEISDGTCIPDLQTAMNNIHACADYLNLSVTIELNKAALLRQFEFDRNRYRHAILYIFTDNFLNLLNSPLHNLDDTLFSGPGERTIIVVLDSAIYLRGPFLTIAAPNSLASDSAVPPQKMLNWTSRIDAYYTIATENLNWSGFRLKHLTPLHLICDRVVGSVAELDRILARHLLHLCILYTANRSALENNHLLSYFTSTDRVVALELDAGDNNTGDIRGALIRLALWPYSGKETDRITILQTVVARELESENPKENYASFKSQIQRLINEARWHHRVFLDGRIDKHFEQVQSVAGYVTEMAKEVSKTLDSVTKGLTDALLATVGVIVLTLLASLVKNETQGAIFRIGMWAYAGYLLVFQGLYRLGSIWHSYRVLREETESQLSLYGLALGRRKVKELSSPLLDREGQFTLWFWLTAAIYVLVIVTVVWLGSFLPHLLEDTLGSNLLVESV